MKVVKRNKDVVAYDGSKVKNAVIKAMVEVEGFIDNELIDEIERDVRLLTMHTKPTINVEQIQDYIELKLMTRYPQIAKAYILYRHKRTEIRNKEWEMTELQRDIYNNKYRHDGESFDEFIERVSGGNTKIAKLIREQKFLFAGRILAGRGLDRNVTLSNCYVLPQPDDNIESIFDIAKLSARTYSYGGGVGFDLSKLRPRGAKVNNASLTTSGPVSFMTLYDTTTRVIGQHGRRGALMLSMSTDHPDINEFIESKKNVDDITHANISVRSTGDLFKLDTPEKRETLKLIAKNNWETGEPGMLFQNRIDTWHLLSEHPEYNITSTNPCGEQPLPEYGNCLLGSMNLSKYVINPFTDKAYIDIDSLKEDIRTAVIGLNEVLDEGIPLHPLAEQRETARKFRQIGLGIMGLADMFIKLGVVYGSEESFAISKFVGEIFRDEAIRESINLAKEDGPYPAYKYEYVKKSAYFKSLPLSLQTAIQKHGMRNSHLLSIAPTGSISTMIGVSGGIEPIFANSYMRTTKSLSGSGDVKYKVYTEVIQELMDKLDIKEEKDLPHYCITSHDINPFNRIRVQSIWQHYVDSAISSTINLHEDTTVETIEDIYKSAYEYGLKGVTVFRDNCFRTGILEVEDDSPSKFECPECGHDLNMAEGCNTCPECGWGQCSI